MEFFKSLQISASAMRAQGERLRVIAENIANADTTASRPGGEPFRRKLVRFDNVLDRALGVKTVRMVGYSLDQTEFARRYDPGHPAADTEGYVLLPNVNPLIEMADMREALRSYQANLSVIKATKTIVQQTIDLLRR